MRTMTVTMSILSFYFSSLPLFIFHDDEFWLSLFRRMYLYQWYYYTQVLEAQAA